MNKKIKVLYISYDGLSDPLGQSQVLAYLRRLAQDNIEIDIISFEKPEVYKAKKAEIEDLVASAQLKWYPLPYTKSPPVLSTLKDLYRGWKKIKALQAQEPYSLVHCRGYAPALLGERMYQKYQVPFIFDMRGWWADEKKESGAWSSPLFQPIYRYFKRKERDFFKKSAQNVSLTYVGKKEIVDSGFAPAEKVGVIPTCVDFDIFKAFEPAVRKKLRRELSIPDGSSVLVYSGSLGGNYGYANFWECFQAYQKVHPDSYFLILSKTEPESARKGLAEAGADLSRIRLKSLPFEEVNAHLMLADLGLILYSPSYSIIGRSPTKLGEYWASGLPAVSLAGIGDVDRIAQKYPSALFLSKSMQEADLEQAFREVQEVPKEALRASAQDYFSIEKGVNFYREIYEQIHQNLPSKA